MNATTRRRFLKATGLVAAAAPATLVGQKTPAAAPARLKLGFDNFSIRALGWKAPRLIEYAAAQKVDALLLSDLDVYESHSPEQLSTVGKMARDAGIELHVGTLAICPTSTRFDKKWGTAEELVALLIKVAQGTGSKVARCVLGFGEDRSTPGGIQARIADTVAVLKKVRSRAVDAGVTLAVENHAGDMTARELVTLIEATGRDFVGATIDSGNATWALEDPLSNLEILAPYIVSSGIRDSMIWEDGDGAKVQWTAVGDGLVDWPAYFDLWRTAAADRPVILETISGFARPFNYLTLDFWKPYEGVPAADFARFLALAKKGKAIPSFRASAEMSEAQFQQTDLERSLHHCREALGLGRS
ncbi:MAG: sugar phosphate isomerase/epimerase family protein [Verrucomicrobiales bacterium]